MMSSRKASAASRVSLRICSRTSSDRADFSRFGMVILAFFHEQYGGKCERSMAVRAVTLEGLAAVLALIGADAGGLALQFGHALAPMTAGALGTTRP